MHLTQLPCSLHPVVKESVLRDGSKNSTYPIAPRWSFFDEAEHEVMRLDSETQRFRIEGSLQMVLEKGYQQDAQLQRWRWKKAVILFNLNAGD